MSRTWAYLTAKEHKLFVEKAISLGMTEGELNQHLIHLFLNTANAGYPDGCLSCQYYRVATSQLISLATQIANFFTVGIPHDKLLIATPEKPIQQPTNPQR